MQNDNKPKNIFEAINLNIVELSQDLVALAVKIDEIHSALYPVSSLNPTDLNNEQHM